MSAVPSMSVEDKNMMVLHASSSSAIDNVSTADAITIIHDDRVGTVTTNNHNNMGVSTTVRAGAAICRVIAIDDEDSRECQSQETSEIERDIISGIDDRYSNTHHSSTNRGDCHRPAKHLLYTTLYNRRFAGLRRHHHGFKGKAFRETRDSNSFDSHDSDTDDELVRHRSPVLQRCRHMVSRKHQLDNQQQHRQLYPKATGEHKVAMVGAQQYFLGEAAATITFNDNKNKRKTPSPVVGLEPAPVTVEPLYDDEVMSSMDEDDNNGNEIVSDSDRFFNTLGYEKKQAQTLRHDEEDGYESDGTLLPSPARRISLSPLSRRLALQFDSISIYSPVRLSGPKRRKICDTSATTSP